MSSATTTASEATTLFHNYGNPEDDIAQILLLYVVGIVAALLAVCVAKVTKCCQRRGRSKLQRNQESDILDRMDLVTEHRALEYRPPRISDVQPGAITNTLFTDALIKKDVQWRDKISPKSKSMKSKNRSFDKPDEQPSIPIEKAVYTHGQARDSSDASAQSIVLHAPESFESIPVIPTKEMTGGPTSSQFISSFDTQGLNTTSTPDYRNDGISSFDKDEKLFTKRNPGKSSVKFNDNVAYCEDLT